MLVFIVELFRLDFLYRYLRVNPVASGNIYFRYEMLPVHLIKRTSFFIQPFPASQYKVLFPPLALEEV